VHGKQLRFHLEDQRVLLIHLMMWGTVRVYRKGEAWDKPREKARVIFSTGSHEGVFFSAPIVKLLTLSELQENPRWGNLGPDPLRSDFSSQEFLRRLLQHPEKEIGESLLDQQVIAGVGNILRIEILHRSCIHPHRLVGSLSQEEKESPLLDLEAFSAMDEEHGKGKDLDPDLSQEREVLSELWGPHRVLPPDGSNTLCMPEVPAVTKEIQAL